MKGNTGNISGKRRISCIFEVSLKRVQNLLDTFDSYGHLDYVVRYAPHKNEFYSWNDYEPYIRPLLKLLIENGKCLECNTGGIRYGLGNTNPCADVFRLYKELGGEGITIGSDAHTPETLGIGFDYCREMLKNMVSAIIQYSTKEKRRCSHYRGVPLFFTEFFTDPCIVPMTFARRLH